MPYQKKYVSVYKIVYDMWGHLNTCTNSELAYCYDNMVDYDL